MNKYEQLVEFIINDENDKARELFHQIVVEKSRDIYESLVSEEDLDETIGGNEVEELVDEVSCDEEGLAEEEEEFDSEEDFGGEEGEFDHHDDVGGDEELEDRVLDLEDALDELKAEFDALMAGEEGEEDFGAEEQFGGEEDFGGKEDEQVFEAEEEDEEEEEEVDESIVREYVEKVASPANSEGQTVGTGKSVSVNKKSTVAGKNDMGGSAANIATGKGGTQNQDGQRPQAGEKPKGTLVSNPQNKPGANAGKSAFKTKEAAKSGEGQTTGQAVGGVNTKSPLRK